MPNVLHQSSSSDHRVTRTLDWVSEQDTSTGALVIGGATVVVDRGRLYTLATSVNEDRWEKVSDLCGRVVLSLNLLI